MRLEEDGVLMVWVRLVWVRLVWVQWEEGGMPAGVPITRYGFPCIDRTLTYSHGLFSLYPQSHKPAFCGCGQHVHLFLTGTPVFMGGVFTIEITYNVHVTDYVWIQPSGLDAWSTGSQGKSTCYLLDL